MLLNKRTTSIFNTPLQSKLNSSGFIYNNNIGLYELNKTIILINEVEYLNAFYVYPSDYDDDDYVEVLINKNDFSFIYTHNLETCNLIFQVEINCVVVNLNVTILNQNQVEIFTNNLFNINDQFVLKIIYLNE